MELIVAIVIAVLSSAGLFLMQTGRLFPVVLGLVLLSQAANVFVFSMGRLIRTAPPLLDAAGSVSADPLPQALVLTAIVISFGMTATAIAVAVWCRAEHHDDGVDDKEGDES